MGSGVICAVILWGGGFPPNVNILGPWAFGVVSLSQSERAAKIYLESYLNRISVWPCQCTKGLKEGEKWLKLPILAKNSPNLWLSSVNISLMTAAIHFIQNSIQLSISFSLRSYIRIWAKSTALQPEFCHIWTFWYFHPIPLLDIEYDYAQNISLEW
jgi:hypothetical protein